MVPTVEEEQYVIEENESGTYRNRQVEEGDRQVHALDVGESIGPHPKAPMVDQQEHGEDDTEVGCFSEPGHRSGTRKNRFLFIDPPFSVDHFSFSIDNR